MPKYKPMSVAIVRQINKDVYYMIARKPLEHEIIDTSDLTAGSNQYDIQPLSRRINPQSNTDTVKGRSRGKISHSRTAYLIQHSRVSV